MKTKQAKQYTKVRYLKDAICRCPEVKLTYVNYREYSIIDLDDWKVLEHFKMLPKSYHAEWGGRYRNYQRIVGYRVSHEVKSIIDANRHIMDMGRYL